MADLSVAYNQLNVNKAYSPNEIQKTRDGLKYQDCADNRELTRLSEDSCSRAYRHDQSTKPIKYITRDFRTLGLNPQSVCYPGFLAQDGVGIPDMGIDSDSHLRIEKPLPRCADVQQLPALQKPTKPFMGRGCGEPGIENDLRAGLFNRPNKSCQPKGTDFEQRSFQIFDHLCYDPQRVDTVVMPKQFNSKIGGVQCNYLGGCDSRHSYDQEDIRGNGYGLPVLPNRFLA